MANVVIIGAGQAGAKAALALREGGWEGEIVIFGEESLPPYERPPLSKEVLLGQSALEDTFIVPRDVYTQGRIELRLNTKVTSVNIEHHLVCTTDGQELTYDHLVFATGARARALPTQGAELQGIFTLRDAEDARTLGEALAKAKRVAIIGGGFVGLEVAAAARKFGLPTTVIEQNPSCLSRVLPASAVAPITDYHISNGVEILCSRAIKAIEGQGQVERVRLQDDTVVDADVLVVGIGSIANDELARDAGIECANGILVDAECRTSAPNVYAIGDVASRMDELVGRAMRMESWENAERQGAIVAASILAISLPETGAPWFWTDQYDLNVQIIGTPDAGDTLVERAGDGHNQSIQFYLRNGLLASVVMFNSGREKRTLTKMIGNRYAPAELQNASLPLRQLSSL